MALYAVRRRGCGTSRSCGHDVLAQFADLDEALDFSESRGGEVVRISDGWRWTADGWLAPDNQTAGGCMSIVTGTIQEILDATEFLTIVTFDDEGPHVVANWGEYQRSLGTEGDTIVLPAGHYNRTEANLRRNGRIQVMVASRKVAGSHGPGQGCVLSGRGEIVTDGPLADKVKAKFRWARGALLIHVEAAKLQL